MVLHATLEPESLDRDLFKDEQYVRGARYFFRSLYACGLLIVDQKGQLGHQILEQIGRLHTKDGQQINLLLTEIAKKQLIRCDTTEPAAKAFHTVGKLSEKHELDGIAYRPNQLDRVGQHYRRAADAAFSFDTYFESRFETKRLELEERPSSIRNLSEDDFKALLRPVLKYTSTLRFFDPQIGKSDSLSHFLQGFNLILRAWSECCGIPAAERSIELYTLVPNSFDEKTPNVETALQRIWTDLLTPLRQKYGVSTALRAKRCERDKRRDAHARYLQAGSFVIHFERGFDFIHSSGRFLDTPVVLDNTARASLKWWRGLPDYKAQ